MGNVKPKLNLATLLVFVFLLLEVIGILYTENLDRGFFDLQLKLTLLAFTVAFLGFEFNEALDKESTLKFFVLGAVVAASICLFQSAFKVIYLGSAYYHFLTSRYSVLMHQTYFALYLNMAILIKVVQSWHLLNDRHSEGFKKSLLTLAFLTLGVVLAGSKTGFIMLILNLTGIFIALIKSFERKWIAILISTSSMLLIVLMFAFIPYLNERITNMLGAFEKEKISAEATESTAVRTLIYKSSKDIVMHQPWYGQGTGDFQDRLDEYYHENGYIHLYEQHLNAHNLFYQVWIALGIPGLLTLISIFILLIVKSISTRKYIYLGFSLLFLIVALTESALYVQAGLTFFAFYTLMFAKDDDYPIRLTSHY